MEQLSLFDIEFPIYTITKSYKNIWEEGNILYIETPYGISILDNKNMDGNTVGKRRIKINNSRLYRPRKVYYNISQMIHSKDSTFMDTHGKVFKYKKTEMVPLKYHKVGSITRAQDGECVLEVPKINFSYKTTCRNAYTIEYVGLLHTKFGYIVYDFTDIKKPDTRRKI